MFVYQPTFKMVKYENTSTEYGASCKLKGVYNNKLIALNSDFLPNIKYFKRIRSQFDNTPLVIEQNNYTTKFVNVYIVYDLNHWSKVLLEKNCLFGTTNMAKS